LHYLWVVLIARIYEVFPLLCPMCGGQTRIIAFITHSADIRQILDHIGVDSELPHISPACGPPLWDDCGDAQMGESVEVEPGWDMTAQPAPDYEVASASTGNEARRRLDALRGVAACVADSRPFGEQGRRQSCGSAAQTSGCEGSILATKPVPYLGSCG
jgi:hypothetical protein